MKIWQEFGVKVMNELKIILENFRIIENSIQTRYRNILMMFPPNHFISKEKIDEFNKRREEVIAEFNKELQQLQKQKTEAIKEYYKKQDEKISNMTDRQLLEEVYRGMCNGK